MYESDGDRQNGDRDTARAPHSSSPNVHCSARHPPPKIQLPSWTKYQLNVSGLLVKNARIVTQQKNSSHLELTSTGDVFAVFVDDRCLTSALAIIDFIKG